MLVQNQHRPIKRIIPIFEVTAVSASNQPANDDVQVLSDSASDTQQITLWGIDNSDVFQVHTVTLNGTTAVDSVLNPKWKTIYGAFLGDKFGNISKRAVGTITIREKSGSQAISTIAATKLSTGIQFFDVEGLDVVVENITGNTWFGFDVPTITGACGQLTGRMKIEVVPPKYIGLISDGSSSTAQIYVLGL